MSPPDIASAFVCAAVALVSCVVHSQPTRGPDAPEEPPPAVPSLPLADSVPSEEWHGGIDVLAPPERLLLAPHPGTEVAACISYAVGPRDEASGHEGLNELVGALLEGATRKADGASYASVLRTRGAHLERRGSADFSQFCVNAPSSELELAIVTLGATLTLPALTAEAREDALSALDVRRKTLESGYGIGALKLSALSFQGYAPYDHDNTWDTARFKSVSDDELRAFHAQHYRADNAVVSVSGDFSAERVSELVTKYLESKAGGERTPRGRPGPLPRQTSERFAVVESASVETPAAYYGWTLAGLSAQDLAALSVLEALFIERGTRALSHAGDSNELLASAPSAWHAGHHGPELFALGLVAAKGVRLEALSAALDAQLARWQQLGPSAEDCERVRTELLSQLELPGTSPLKHAQRVGEVALSTRSQNVAAMLTQVRPEDVRHVARQLTSRRRTVVEVYPPGMLKAPEVVRQRFHVVGFGETLIGIARRYATTLEALASANDISPRKAIFPGQKLRLPLGARAPVQPKKTAEKKAKPLRTHRVVRGDTLIGIAKRYGVSARDLAKQNGQTAKKTIRVGQTLIIPAAP